MNKQKWIFGFFILVLAVIFLFIFYNTQTNGGTSYMYVDGTGNQYAVTGGTLEYAPVMAKESSSGVYSGGEKRQIDLSAAQSEEIKKLFDEAFADTEGQIENRELLSGYIEVKLKEGRKSAILAPGSTYQTRIDGFFKTLIGR